MPYRGAVDRIDNPDECQCLICPCASCFALMCFMCAAYGGTLVAEGLTHTFKNTTCHVEKLRQGYYISGRHHGPQNLTLHVCDETVTAPESGKRLWKIEWGGYLPYHEKCDLAYLPRTFSCNLVVGSDGTFERVTQQTLNGNMLLGGICLLAGVLVTCVCLAMAWMGFEDCAADARERSAEDIDRYLMLEGPPPAVEVTLQ
eukprot:TRINITY_DN83000_c0_g1_i1.p1 TRINITY_DN83000_c0_g1~~TRINITY_DN83000_c0_g1_i1.p1  ORF type:complete len:201 (+),score=13.53 TRINITY_DN83000_c0_g1_i1:43-645(+)